MSVGVYEILSLILAPMMIAVAVFLLKGYKRKWAEVSEIEELMNWVDELHHGHTWQTVDEKYIMRTGW